MPMIGLSELFFFRWFLSQLSHRHTQNVYGFFLSLLISVGWLIGLKCCLYAIFISIAHLPAVQFIAWLRFCSRCFGRCFFCCLTQFAPVEWETGFALSTIDTDPRCLRIHWDCLIVRRFPPELWIFIYIIWDNLNVESQLFFGITYIKRFDIFNFTRFTRAGICSLAHHRNLFLSRLSLWLANRTELLFLTFVRAFVRPLLSKSLNYF